MGNCGGLLKKELGPNQSHPHGGPPGQRKNSHDDKRRGSDDSHGKGHGHGHGQGHGHGNKKH